jgi:hypothetical protein
MFGGSKVRIVDLNPSRSINVSVCYFVLWLSCASRDLAVYLYSSKCGSQMSDIFTVSENNPEQELARD